MLSLTLCVFAIGQTLSPPAVPSPIFSGTWKIVANTEPGEFTLSTAKGNQIYGNIFSGLWIGTFDPTTNKVEFTRRQLRPNGESFDVQAYTGKLTAVIDKNPPSYTIKGTFRTVAGRDWGTPGVEYDWRADAIIPPNRAQELAQLQGEWEVGDAQTTAGTSYRLPDEIHLTQKGSKITIHGNELLWDGRIVATLANDLFNPDVVKNLGVKGRRPLMITLPNGKGIMCAYAITDTGISIVYPHTIGGVGSGQFIWLKRSTK